MQSQNLLSKNFIFLFIANLVFNIATNGVNSMVEQYSALLGVTPMAVGAIVGLYYGAALAFRPFVGPIQMRFEQRRLLILVFGLSIVIYLGYAFSPSLFTFMIFRAAGGFAGSLSASLTLTAASYSLPTAKMSSGLGIFALTSTIGAALGPGIAITIKDFFASHGQAASGFRSLFVLAAGMCCISLMCVVLVRFRAPDSLNPEPENAAAWYRNIVDRSAVFPALLAMLTDMPNALFTAYMASYAAERGITGIPAFFIVYSAVLTISRPVLGHLPDKYGLRRVMIPFSVLYMLGLACLSIVTSLPEVLCCAAAAAIGFGVIQPGIQAACMQSVPENRRAIAGNTYYFGMDLGRTIAPVLFGGWVYTWTGNYGVMFLSTSACVAAAVFLLMLQPKKHN